MSASASEPGIADLNTRVAQFRERMRAARAAVEGVDFYPYDTLGNLRTVDELLRHSRCNLQQLSGGLPVADLGAGDGDLGFFLESCGLEVDLVDHAATNFNGMRGARALKEVLGSRAEIQEADLDAPFTMPHPEYGLTMFLGVLYHLKNPYQVLERLARISRHMVLSTRVAMYVPSTESPVRPSSLLAELLGRVLAPKQGMTRISGLPVAYLVDERECNDDATNFWIFSPEGLRRILARTGWEIVDFVTTGNQFNSDPTTPRGDERFFCLARSRNHAARTPTQ